MFFKKVCKLNKNEVTGKLKSLAKKIDVPLNAIKDGAHYEINSNREVIVEGCRGILMYEENIVKINMQNMVSVFCGRKLTIKCLTEDSLIITGFITSVQFMV